MPNGILRALKVTLAEASDKHESATTNNRDTKTLEAAKRSKTVSSPLLPVSSQSSSRRIYSFESASLTTRSRPDKISNNSASNQKFTFDVGSQGKRQRRLKRIWLFGHRDTPSQPGSKGVAPVDHSPLSNVSDIPRCLSPVPKSHDLQDHTEILSTDHKECQLASNFALEKTSGRRNAAARIMVSGLKFPLEFALHVAKGFHNAPKLYGDHTVRSLPKIKGFKTGLESSGRVIYLLYTCANADLIRSLSSGFTTAFQE